MEINIKPLEIVADAAKDFLQKVITPPLEEIGLLFADKVKFWRFKNQINVLIKADAGLSKCQYGRCVKKTEYHRDQNNKIYYSGLHFDILRYTILQAAHLHPGK